MAIKEPQAMSTEALMKMAAQTDPALGTEESDTDNDNTDEKDSPDEDEGTDSENSNEEKTEE